MSQPQLFRRWEEHTFHLAGIPIRLKVKAPSFAYEAEFNRHFMTWGLRAQKSRAAIDAAKAAGQPMPEEALNDLLGALDPEWARGVFARDVRVVEPIALEDEPDGRDKVETGEQLFEIATQALVMEVLGKIAEKARLGLSAGKASASLSIAGSERTTGDGASPATSTESGDGPTP